MTNQEQIIATISGLLVEAEQGKITAFAYAGLRPKNLGFHGVRAEEYLRLQVETKCLLNMIEQNLTSYSLVTWLFIQR